MAKWYWILAAACLIGTVGITVSTWQKAQHRNIEELRVQGMTAVFNERWDEAGDKLETIVETKNATARDWFMYGYAVHNLGQHQEAVEAFKKAETLGYNDGLTQYNIACGYIRMGQNEKALPHLEKAVNNGFTDVVWMHQDTDLDPVRDLPEFDKIIKLASQSQSLKSQQDQTTQPPDQSSGNANEEGNTPEGNP